MADDSLIALATKEIGRLGLACASEVEDGAVVRMPKVYPVYDGEYAAALTTIRQFLASIENLQLVAATACTSTTTRTIRC
jgi:protoporphyrinogen oxidase